MVEIDADGLLVNIMVEVKNIDLDIARHPINGWPVADVCHPLVKLIAHVYRYREDTVGGDEFVGFTNEDICGWVTNLPTYLVAANNFAADKKRVAQILVCEGNLIAQ